MARGDEEVEAPLDCSKVRFAADEVRSHEVYGVNRTWLGMVIELPAAEGNSI